MPHHDQYSDNPHWRSLRPLCVLLVLLLTAVACSSSPGSESGTRVEGESASDGTQQISRADEPVPVEDGQDSGGAPSAQQPSSAPTSSPSASPPDASASATATSTPADPTTTVLVVPTPAVDKNQPVFRQAQVDGDSAAAPRQLTVLSGSGRSIADELSAYTDRVDAFELVLPADATEVSLAWSCREYAAQDDRPVAITVEQGGSVVARAKCQQLVAAGTAQLSVPDGAPLLVVFDIESTAVEPTANVFVAYELTVGVVAAEDAGQVSSPDPTVTPVPASTAEPEDEADPTVTPVPASTAEPEDEADPTVTPEPAPTATDSGTLPDPTVTPEPTPTAAPTPTPLPTPAPPPDGGDGDNDDAPAPTNGVVAPNDGDSSETPQTVADNGFLIGSVSAPQGDAVDWSAFTVGPNDPTFLVAGVLCDNFTSSDGSGRLTVTVYEGQNVVADFSCSAGVFEDFGPLQLAQGSTYLVEARFTGTGYSDWLFTVADDD